MQSKRNLLSMQWKRKSDCQVLINNKAIRPCVDQELACNPFRSIGGDPAKSSIDQRAEPQ